MSDQFSCYSSDAVSESPSTVRSKTPTQEYVDGLDNHQRTRAKTPTDGRERMLGLDGHRRDYIPPGYEANSRPGYYNPYGSPQDYNSRDNDYRGDLHAFSPTRRDYPGLFDRDFGRSDGEPRKEMRSRTPGPEFMRGTNAEDAYLRARTEMRSKTPTHEVHYQQPHNISGTPDFIPASRYHVPSSPSTSRHGDRGRPFPGPDLMSPPNNGQPSPSQLRLNSSQTYAGNLNYASHDRGLPYNLQSPTDERGRPRKQSTSFENEEPVPSNLTRLPRGDRWTDSPSNSLNRSRSPTQFKENGPYTELTVFLKRQENGFGFRIIGGTEEGSQVRDIFSRCMK